MTNLFTTLPNIRKHKECYSKGRGEEYGIQKTIVNAERYLVYGVKGNLFPVSVYTKNHLKCVVKVARDIGLQNSYEESCQQNGAHAPARKLSTDLYDIRVLSVQ